jgi:flavorubredoxin
MLLDSIKDLDIETIAPQHGAVYKGKEVINEFFDYLRNLTCGYELMKDVFKVPQ